MDTKTLIIAALVVAAAASLSMAIVFWTRRTYPGFGYWLAGSGCRVLAGVLYLLPRDQFPPWLTIVLPNYLIFAELILYLRGTLIFRGQAVQDRWDLAGSLVFLALFFWFTFVDPSMNARVAVHSLFSSAWMLRLAQVLLTRRPTYSGSFDLWQAGVWTVLSAVNLSRAAYVGLLAPPLQNYLIGAAHLSEWVLFMVLASVLVTLSQIMMNAQRLEYDLRRTQQALEQDIIEREQAEEQLRISEVRHRLLAENALDVVWTIEPDGTISYVSPAVEKLRGFTPDEAMHQPLAEIHPPASLAISQGYFQDLQSRILAGLPLEPFRGELEYWCKDGSTVWCYVMVLPLLGSDGTFRQLLGVSRDISERKRDEQTLLHAKEETERANRALAVANEKLYQLATTDRLTGVANRWSFEGEIEHEIRRTIRYGEPLSLILFDIDHFKAINDRHGHLVGDQVLIALSQRVRDRLRSVDVLARWGGEEFVIMLPHCGSAEAEQLAEKLRALIAAEPFPTVGQVTSSFGVAEFNPRESADVWLNRADDALYQAKAAGRNRVYAATH